LQAFSTILIASVLCCEAGYDAIRTPYGRLHTIRPWLLFSDVEYTLKHYGTQNITLIAVAVFSGGRATYVGGGAAEIMSICQSVTFTCKMSCGRW